MKIWAKTEEFKEGKYLVIRRDGTIPHWPHFVIGGDDPNASAGLRAYADSAEKNGLDPAYVASIRELANDFDERVKAIASGKIKGKADPDAPPHRKDNPAIIEMMRGEGDLEAYRHRTATIHSGSEMGAQVFVYFVNPSGFYDCRLAEDFGTLRKGEILVVRPEHIDPPIGVRPPAPE